MNQHAACGWPRPVQPGAPGVGVLPLRPRTLSDPSTWSFPVGCLTQRRGQCRGPQDRPSSVGHPTACDSQTSVPGQPWGLGPSRGPIGPGQPRCPTKPACRLEEARPQQPAGRGASWRVWQGSLSDDSRGREFPNDWEYFYFWACARFLPRTQYTPDKAEHKGPFRPFPFQCGCRGPPRPRQAPQEERLGRAVEREPNLLRVGSGSEVRSWTGLGPVPRTKAVCKQTSLFQEL